MLKTTGNVSEDDHDVRKRKLVPIKTRQQRANAMAQRRANRNAQRAGLPLPFPSIWDTLDPTKVPRDATPEQITASYKAFCEICPPPKRIEYTI